MKRVSYIFICFDHFEEGRLLKDEYVPTGVHSTMSLAQFSNGFMYIFNAS